MVSWGNILTTVRLLSTSLALSIERQPNDKGISSILCMPLAVPGRYSATLFLSL